MILIMLALVGLGMGSQLAAHNGYSHKKKTTTHAQKRKHAYQALLGKAKHVAVAAPAPKVAVPAVAVAGPAKRNSSQRGPAHFSVKKVLAMLLLLMSARQTMIPAATDEQLFLQPRINALWSEIASRAGLPAGLPIIIDETTAARGHYMHTGNDRIHFGRQDGVFHDDVLAFILGHEAIHLKYDLNERGFLTTSICENARIAGLALPEVEMSEQEVVAIFIEKYLSTEAWNASLSRKQAQDFFHLAGEYAAITSCALGRLEEFRADRLGCVIAGIKNCSLAAQQLFQRNDNNSSRYSHPANERRIAALEWAQHEEVSSNLDATGVYSDIDLLKVVLRAEQLFDRYLELNPKKRGLIYFVQYLPTVFEHPVILSGLTICFLAGIGTIISCGGKGVLRFLRWCKRA